MKINFLNKEYKEVRHETFRFPAGEVGFKLLRRSFFLDDQPANNKFLIQHTFRNSDDIMELVMAVNALRENFDHDIDLYADLFYLPYGRQDRVCEKGESFSLKAFAGIINSLGFKQVRVYDPHSDVTRGVLNNCLVVPQSQIVSNFKELNNFVMTNDAVLIAPDAGANKKTLELAKYFNTDFIRADKVRDVCTGNITGTKVYTDSLVDKNVLVCDDICDGGRTFLELAKECKKLGSKSFSLYVTHGVFSKGTQTLFDNGIDNIFTTDSYYQGNDSKVKVHKLFY